MKRSRLIPTAATLAMAMMCMCACAGPNAAEGAKGKDSKAATINVGSLYEPTNLSNTGGGGQGVTEALTGNVYETLFRLEDNGKVKPWLATKDEASPDGLTHTLSLRKGVTFSSGKALSAKDVAASIKTVLSEQSQAASKKELSVIKDVTAQGEDAVKLTLSEPSVSLQYNLSGLWIVPEGLDTKKKTEGTGPYTLDKWTKGSTLSLKARKDYWGEKPANSAAVFHYYTDAAALTNALKAGDVDVVTNVQSPDALPELEKDAKYKVASGNSTTKELLAFNDRVAPFDDARVRQAIYSAIDRKKLLHSIWNDKGQVIGSMVPPSDPWYEDLNSLNPYDPARSQKLLKEAGKEGLSFTLDAPTYDPHPLVAEFVKSELAKIGVEVKINSISADEWYSKVFKDHNFTATLQEHVNTRDVVWYGNPDFYWGYNNPQVTDLVAKSQKAANVKEQTELLRKANRIIATDAASAWLYLYPQVVVSKAGVSGYGVNGLNSQFFLAPISKKA